ncbi:hypothetical protein H7849_24600 [Alloacidobacterium dinghuense]|uniref:Uncharacterized protein n=1 Tax=Alloacidobacterium dinghuense TaxID=2763107 RepID=A0A7G8BHW6_9BACT|nr:hypothetical protein [Alloacidobacterium dinghuense]QNI32136.1 hypothetical protein H7849_24600 [Alloacidobacterium dinghuense]
MTRYEPPPLATWILEHLAPGHQNEALAGDLLEDFRAGRSSRWYWRQVLAACLAAWLRYLGDRKMIVVFAVVWSMFAPAWTTLQERIMHGPEHMWRMDLSFKGISTIAVWLTLNLIFLWAGVLFYFISHPHFTKRFTRRQVTRAFLLAAFVFLPAYIATFIVTNLYFFPGPQVDRSTMTLLGEFMDVRLWANAIRIPFLVTLLCALWQAIPRSQKMQAIPAMGGRPARSLIDGIWLDSSSDELSVKQCFVLVVAAGLVNSLITAYLLCHLPESHSPSLASLFVRAVIYILFGLVGGAIGAWLYWNRPSSPFRIDPPVPFGLLALICSATWVWTPPSMLLSLQSSPVAPFISIVGAALLATSLRGIASVVLAPAQPSLSSFVYGNGDLFATALYEPPFEAHGFVIALCIYASGYALFHGFTLASSAFGAVATFLFGWKWGFAPPETFDRTTERERAVLRLTLVALPAVFVTFWAMLGVSYHNELGSIGAMANAIAKANVRIKSPASFPSYGYESIILLPPPAKKELVFPFSAPGRLTAPEKSHPLVIHFDGPYWYLQPPDIRPGPMAHKAHGTPLSVNIKSNNSIPLIMQAHQSLGRSINIARCREIQIQIDNRDTESGTITMAVFVTDSILPGRPTLSLGTKSLTSPASIGAQPRHETLSFPFPAHTSFRRFDRITISLLPDMRHSLVAPKIAIEQFQIFPR